MKVLLYEHVCRIEREPTDPKYSFTMSGESWFLYHVKQALIKQGHDVIKKLMWKDGHLFGDDRLPYIRERRWRFYLYDSQYAVRSITQEFAQSGSAVLQVWRGEHEN